MYNYSLPILNKTIRFGYFGMHGFGAVIIWFTIRLGVFLSSKTNKTLLPNF